MSLNVKTIQLLENEEVSLRLTTKAICTYVLKHGVKDAPPLVAVLSAVDNLEAKIDLFSGALQYPGNTNKIKKGDDLLDLLADAGYNRDGVNCLILELARDAGLVDDDNLVQLSDAVKLNGEKTVDALVSLLQGKTPENETDEGAKNAENPT